MTVAYVWAKPEKYMQLLQIRNRVHNVVDTDYYYRKQKPHITVVPSFKIKDDSKEEIIDIVRKSNLEGTQIDVGSIDAYESLDSPFAIYLNADIDQNEVKDLISELQQYSKVPITKPSNAHISLMKTRGCWDQVGEDVKNRLNHEANNQPNIDSLDIDSVKVEFKR